MLFPPGEGTDKAEKNCDRSAVLQMEDFERKKPSIKLFWNSSVEAVEDMLSSFLFSFYLNLVFSQ